MTLQSRSLGCTLRGDVLIFFCLSIDMGKALTDLVGGGFLRVWGWWVWGLALVVDEEAEGHEHGDESVDFLIACSLDGLGVAEVVGVEDGVAEAVGVDGVGVDEDVACLASVLEGLDGCGEVAVGLLYAA